MGPVTRGWIWLLPAVVGRVPCSTSFERRSHIHADGQRLSFADESFGFGSFAARSRDVIDPYRWIPAARIPRPGGRLMFETELPPLQLCYRVTLLVRRRTRTAKPTTARHRLWFRGDTRWETFGRQCGGRSWWSSWL